MALYRTEHRLNWHHSLRIGHWYAPWSQTQADTGADYFSRALRWLRDQYPKATVNSASLALPAANEDWPKERFGLPPKQAQETDTAADALLDPEDNAAKETPHAGDLLLIEWPQPMAEAKTLPPQWVNGLERALRRHWQDNPLAEVLFIGGPHGIPQQGLALAAHYGIGALDPAQLLRPADATATDHRQALICEGTTDSPATLTPQGQEIWAGMLIGLLRQQVRYGPTPTPVSLPDGLWCR